LLFPQAQNYISSLQGKGRAMEEHAIVTVTGLRNPCPQIAGFQKGPNERSLVRDGMNAVVVRKAGIMGVVDVGGVVEPGRCIVVERPETFRPLACV